VWSSLILSQISHVDFMLISSKGHSHSFPDLLFWGLGLFGGPIRQETGRYAGILIKGQRGIAELNHLFRPETFRPSPYCVKQKSCGKQRQAENRAPQIKIVTSAMFGAPSH
jgi:hypothetical protein